MPAPALAVLPSHVATWLACVTHDLLSHVALPHPRGAAALASTACSALGCRSGDDTTDTGRPGFRAAHPTCRRDCLAAHRRRERPGAPPPSPLCRAWLSSVFCARCREPRHPTRN